MNPKTDLPCDCGLICHEMSEPDSAYSLRNNMFLINEHIVMYFCPSCGGKLPDSSKPIYAPYLTAEERTRLDEMARGVSSPEEAIAHLGEPDYDAPMLTYRVPDEIDPIVYSGPLHEHPTHLPLDTSSPQVRNMEYYGLSETGNIEFYFSEGQQPRWRVQPKLLSPRHLKEGEII